MSFAHSSIDSEVPTSAMVERRIHRGFDQLEEQLGSLRDLINDCSRDRSSMMWFPRIRNCEQQLGRLFLTTYAAEVFYRQPAEVELDQAVRGGDL